MSKIVFQEKEYTTVILRDISHRDSLEKLILKQYESLNTLHLIALGLLNRRDIKDLLQFIVNEAVKLLEVSYCEILLPEGDELVAQAFTNDGPFEKDNRFKRADGGLSWQVFDTGYPIIVDDYSSWPERHQLYERQSFHAAAALPLLVGDQCIGVLGLTRERKGYKFSEEQLLIATRLAAIAALAIENSRLYIEVNRLATVDELTGVQNRRSLMGMGQAEVDRAVRYNRPISLLMLDIDHFKRVNDTWGHAVGDRVLRGVAQEVNSRLRKSDAIGRFNPVSDQVDNIVGRLGGEEFGILLPETSLEQAQTAAERIRTSIQELVFDIPDGEIRVTVSIGVAALSAQVQNLSDMLAGADHALYKAKEAGRNCVHLFTSRE